MLILKEQADLGFVLIGQAYLSEQNSCQYSKTCLKQPLKKDKTKILITNGSLMKVKRIAEF